MKKLLLFLLSGIFALQACAQQASIIAHRVMALDSFYVDGIWFKASDIARWNAAATSGNQIDTMFVRNDSLVYSKGGIEYHLKVGSAAVDSSMYATVYHADSIAGLIPKKTSDLTNDAGFLSSVTWAIISGKPSFAMVATTGSYNDLADKPSVYTQSQSDSRYPQKSALVDTAAAIRADFPAGGGTIDTTSLSARIDNKKNLAESDLSQPDSTSRTYNAHMGQLSFNFGGAGGKSASLLLEPNNFSWLASQDDHGVMFQNGSTGFQILGNSGSGWSNGIATFAYGGKITFPGYPNNANRDSVFAPFADGSLGMRYMPPADSVLKKSELLDTLAKHAVNVHAPLVYNPADTSISADTSSAETAVALKWWVKSLFGAGSGLGDMLKSIYDPTGVNGDAFDYNNLHNKPTIPGTPTLNDVLSAGNTSTVDMTVSGVQAEGYVMDDGTGTTFNIPLLGTNSVGLIGPADMSVVTLADMSINTVTGTTHTLALTDKHKMNNFTSATAVVITVPTNASVAFPVGSRIVIRRGGAGTVTFSPASGVTIQSVGDKLSIASQYGLVEIDKIDTNTWALFGNL